MLRSTASSLLLDVFVCGPSASTGLEAIIVARRLFKETDLSFWFFLLNFAARPFKKTNLAKVLV
jgi:hypothetical protein